MSLDGRTIALLGNALGDYQAGLALAKEIGTIEQGGAGVTATNHAILLGLGTSGVGVVAIGTAGRVLVDQGAAADPQLKAVSGDGTLASTGAITILKTNGVVFAPSATTDATNASNITSGTLPAARLPTVGGTLTQFASPIITDADAATITLDLSAGNWHATTLAADGHVVAVANVVAGQEFFYVVTQGGTGSNTLTWFSGILWAGGSPPTLTATLGKTDVLQFKRTAPGVYLGKVWGANF